MRNKFTTVENGEAKLRELINSDLSKLSEYADNFEIKGLQQKLSV